MASTEIYIHRVQSLSPSSFTTEATHNFDPSFSNSPTRPALDFDAEKGPFYFPADNNEEEEEEEEEEFPEGGLQAYLTVFGSFMGLVPAFGIMGTTGAIQTFIASNQLSDVSTSTIAWIFSLFNFILYASAIFSGAYFDRSGARRPLCFGSLMFVGGLMTTASSTSVTHFTLSFGVVSALGVGILMSPLISVVSHYFMRKRATYTSIATLGASVGAIAFPMILKKLYPTVGFPWAMRILGFICLGCLAVSILFAKERMRKEKPQVTGLVSFVHVNVLDIFDYMGFKDFRYVCVVFAVSFGESSLMATSTYFPSYATMREFSSNTAYLLVAVMNAAGIGGRFLPAYLSDRFWGPFNTVILTNFFAMLSMWVIWLPFGNEIGALYAFAVIYGFLNGSIYTLSPVVVGAVSKTEDFDKRYSTMYMVTALTMLVTIPVAGTIVGDGGVVRYNHFIVFSSIVGFLFVILHCLTRWKTVGIKVPARV